MTQTAWLHFADYRLHPGQRALCRGESRIELGSRAMDVLIALIRRAGETASKSQIMADVWGTTKVEDNNLTTQIAALRRALGDTGRARVIQTVPGRGYRFAAELGAPAPARPGAAARQAESERGSLPLQSSSFIGRERELADIAARLQSRPLVSLVGAGGVGKTRAALKLASEMADGFADGVLLAELAPLTENARVAELLCRLLGVTVFQERTAQDSCVTMLRGRAMLLVLDNCEHVLEGAAALADALLRHCPGLRVLATSRQALGVAGEAVFLMPTLGVPRHEGALSADAAMRCDAVRLFAERAADALGSYTLSDEEAPIVAGICRQLDGVPLAVELAAARLRMLKPAEIAKRLEDVFRLLTGGSRTALPRQQTLRATIDWSFSLLGAAEQIVLARLSVFVDGCTAEGASAVAGGEGIEADEVFDLVGALVSKSLMVADVSGRATRYRMLETTRQYAAEKLGNAGARARLMAEYMLRVFTAAEESWPTTATDDWLATFSPETANFRRAIDWAFCRGGDPALGVSLVAQSRALTEEMSLEPDLARWTRMAAAHVGEATPPGEYARLLYLRTIPQKRLAPGDSAADRMDAIARFRALGDRPWLSRALKQMAIARAMPGPVSAEMLDTVSEAVALLADLAPHKDLASALGHTGALHFLAGDHDVSRRFNEQALAMRRALGDRSGALASAVNLAELLFMEGKVGLALNYAMQAEAEARQVRAQATLALILSNIAGYRLAVDDIAAGRAAAWEGLKLSRALGQDYLAVQCLEHLALALGLADDIARAARLLGYTQACYARAGQVRERQEQIGHDRLAALLVARLGGERMDELAAEGGQWRAEEADAVGLR